MVWGYHQGWLPLTHHEAQGLATNVTGPLPSPSRLEDGKHLIGISSEHTMNTAPMKNQTWGSMGGQTCAISVHMHNAVIMHIKNISKYLYTDIPMAVDVDKICKYLG